jgi:hypothetical protein
MNNENHYDFYTIHVSLIKAYLSKEIALNSQSIVWKEWLHYESNLPLTA